MYGVELYAAVRLAVVDEGLSHHEAGRQFGIGSTKIRGVKVADIDVERPDVDLERPLGLQNEVSPFDPTEFGTPPERQGRNPRTGETITIVASKVPSFKAGKALRDAVR